MHHSELIELPLFPLPDAVLFPGQALPLHVFEPRYREMTAAAISGQGRIGVALLQHGYEDLYFTTQAPIHRMVGVGRIVEAEEMPDGRYNLLLQGECRGTIDCEIPGQTFRIAQVAPRPTQLDLNAAGIAQVRTDLGNLLSRGLAGNCKMLFSEGLRLLQSSLELEMCVNLIASALPVNGDIRQALLESDSLGQRSSALREAVARLVSDGESGHYDLPPASLN